MHANNLVVPPGMKEGLHFICPNGRKESRRERGRYKSEITTDLYIRIDIKMDLSLYGPGVSLYLLHEDTGHP